jgi:hypothetical protein
LRSNHATRLIAIPFIMIVVTTSCAPVLTLRIPGTNAQNIEASIAAMITKGRSATAGSPSNPLAAAAAAASATMY